MTDEVFDFIDETGLALLSPDPLKAVVKLPLYVRVNMSAKERQRRGKAVDVHMRLPQGLMDDLATIAKRYPTARNTLIRIFLELAVKQWEVERAKKAEEMKPLLERAAKRVMGEGRNK